MNEKSIEYSNDLQFSRPWKRRQWPWVWSTLNNTWKNSLTKQSPVLVYENPWAMYDSGGTDTDPSPLETLDSYPEKRHEAIPKFFKCSLGQRPIGTFKSHVMQSRDSKQSFWLAAWVAICRTCGIKVMFVLSILRHNFLQRIPFYPLKICQNPKFKKEFKFSVKTLCYGNKIKTNTAIWQKNINA